MKVAILSMQDVDNFGSLLQAYALKKLLKDDDVQFIKIEQNEADNKLLDGFYLDFTKESSKSDSLLNKISKFDIYIFNRLKIKKLDNCQCKIFDDFRKNNLNIDYKNNYKSYDLCIIGSDEVFNCLIKSKWGFTTQLFGNIKNANNVISYAASCGATTYEKLPEKVKIEISNYLNKMKGISVRDQNTYDFVTKLSYNKCEINLDPVLITDFEEEMKNNPLNIDGDYCIVYSYYNRFNNIKEISLIKKFCKKNKLKIISVGAPQYWIKNHIVCNPFQMLSLFKKAKFVITDTFHGTIFSIKYSSKFATIVRKSNNNKLIDLINRLNMNNHLINDLNSLDNIYELNKSDDDINNKLIIERKHSIKYLNNYTNILNSTVVLSKSGDNDEK